MFRTSLAIAYVSYLFISGGLMMQGLNHAQHVNSAIYQGNLCRLSSDDGHCSRR